MIRKYFSKEYIIKPAGIARILFGDKPGRITKDFFKDGSHTLTVKPLSPKSQLKTL